MRGAVIFTAPDRGLIENGTLGGEREKRMSESSESMSVAVVKATVVPTGSVSGTVVERGDVKIGGLSFTSETVIRTCDEPIRLGAPPSRAVTTMS